MNSYLNLPTDQRHVQQLVDGFNADEQVWESLAGNRRNRRKGYPRVSAKQHEQLDLLEFAVARPPEDCVGFFLKT